jgi:putative heme transporter
VTQPASEAIADPATAVGHVPADQPHPKLVSRRRTWRWLWRALILAAIGLALYELEGNAGELVIAGEQLGHLHAQWVLLGAVLEAASYFAFALSQVRLLRAGGALPGTIPVTEQVFAAQAVANCLPAGAAAAALFSYRAFRRMRVDEGLSAWVILVNNVIYIGALCAIVVIAAELAGKSDNANVPDLRPYAAGLLGFMVVICAVGVVLHRRNLLVGLVHRAARRLGVLRHHAEGTMSAERILSRFTGVSVRRSDLGACTVLLVLAWLCDAACLGLAFPAVGASTPVRGLLIAYAAAQLASAVPLTPGGLGVVEGSLTLALVAYGGTTDATLAAVLLYRILSYWSVMPVGLVGYVLLRRRPLPADIAAHAAAPA